MSMSTQFSDVNIESLTKCIINCYGLDKNTELTLLKYSENLTYLVKTSDESKTVLRVCRPNYHDEKEMLSELIWIHQIKKDTDISTADVIPDINGEFISKCVTNNQEYRCAMFEYMSGKNICKAQGDELYKYMEKVREIAAKLHNHVMKWTASSSLDRFTWDFEDLVGNISRWGDYSEMKSLTNEQMHQYDEAIDIIKERLQIYGKGKGRYGLIHSDLSINNILADGDDIKVLDFDDCGFGWFLYDFSTTVLEYFDDKLKQCMEALLRGYGRFRQLKQEDMEEMDTFIVLRKIVRIGWIATHSDNDSVKNVADDYYDKTAEMAKEYCDKYKVM